MPQSHASESPIPINKSFVVSYCKAVHNCSTVLRTLSEPGPPYHSGFSRNRKSYGERQLLACPGAKQIHGAMDTYILSEHPNEETAWMIQAMQQLTHTSLSARSTSTLIEMLGTCATDNQGGDKRPSISGPTTKCHANGHP
jgi:hypothetical protein